MGAHRPLRGAPVRVLLLVGLLFGAVVLPATANATVKVAFLQGEQVVTVDRPGSTIRQAANALLAGPSPAEKQREITTQVPSGTPLRSVSFAKGVASVDVGEKFVQGRAVESLDARLAQLVLTMRSVPGVRSVRLLVKGGTPLGLFPGYDLRRPVTAKDLAPDLPPPVAPGPGTTAPTPSTRALQQRLADLGFIDVRGVDGRAGEQTRFAVIAFQKWAGLARDGVAGPATSTALATATRPAPITAGGVKRVEILLDRQLALVIDGGIVVRTLHVSSGKSGYETPAGLWTVFRKEQRSWSVPYKVWLPWASYFVGGVAFHEYPDVPVTAASHGCVRVPRYDARWLYEFLAIGTPVSVITRSR